MVSFIYIIVIYILDVNLVVFLLDGIFVIVLGDKIVRLWDIVDFFEFIVFLLVGYFYYVYCCIFLLFGIIFVICFIDGKFIFWDVKLGFKVCEY